MHQNHHILKYELLKTLQTFLLSSCFSLFVSAKLDSHEFNVKIDQKKLINIKWHSKKT